MRIWLMIWLLLVIAVSISPLSFKLRLHTIGPFHDLGHYLVYLLTGVFFWLATTRWSSRVFSFLFIVSFSLAQEWAENRLYHAGYEWKDVIVDAAGLITGYALLALLNALQADPRVNPPRASL